MDQLQLFFISFNFVTTLLLIPHPLNYFYLMIRSRPLYRSLQEKKKSTNQKNCSNRNDVSNWPLTLVQLPIYNEGQLATRLLEATCQLHYQENRCIIQILDDSTDQTPQIIQEWMQKNTCHHQLQVHREYANKHYKAGALQHGLSQAPKARYVAIFDADFIPSPNFLEDSVQYLEKNREVAAVQARWLHENKNENLLTRAIAVSLDMHFLVEKLGQQAVGVLQQFNGSGGMWRISSIKKAGGWNARTIAEDLDLMFRVQLAGELIQYLPSITVSQRIPSNYSAFLIQQNRWAQGFAQNLRLHVKNLWKNSQLTFFQKLQATLLLTSYFFSAVIFLNILSLVGLIWTNAIELLFMPPLFPWSVIPAVLITVTSFLGFLAYFVAGLRGGRSIPRAVMDVVLFAIVSGSMLLSILISCVLGIVRPERTFERTPKESNQTSDISKSWMRTIVWLFPDAVFSLILMATIAKIINVLIFWGYLPALVAICLGTLLKIGSLLKTPLPQKRS